MNFLSHQQSQLLTVSQGRYPPAQYSQEIKVVPSTEVTTTNTGVWGSGGIASCLFTSALGGSESLASRPGRFTSEEKTSIPNAEMVRWAPKRGWMLWQRKSSPDGNRTPVVQPAAPLILSYVYFSQEMISFQKHREGARDFRQCLFMPVQNSRCVNHGFKFE
jgi:hypothetical protein